jgi:hypothetical protein
MLPIVAWEFRMEIISSHPVALLRPTWTRWADGVLDTVHPLGSALHSMWQRWLASRRRKEEGRDL